MQVSVTHTRRARTWLPLVALLALLALSVVTGRGTDVRGAHAATIAVTGSNPNYLFVDTSGCPASSVAIGELVPGDPWKTAQDAGGGGCALDFGISNHVAGAELTILEDPAAAANPADAMKCVGGGCSGDAIGDFQGAAEPAGGTSAFGIQLLGSGGVATPVWSGGSNVYDIQDSGDTACQTAGTGTGTCTFTFGAAASATDATGAYRAQAQALVLAR